MGDNIKVTTIRNGVTSSVEYSPEFVEEQSTQLTNKFLRQCNAFAEVWANYPNKTPLERTTGVLHSVFAILDGSTPGLPAMDLVPVPRPAEEEPATMFNLKMVGRELEFTDREVLTPMTVIRSGNLAHRFVNLNKEAAENVAE